MRCLAALRTSRCVLLAPLLLALMARRVLASTAVVAESPASGQLSLLEAFRRPDVTLIELAGDVSAATTMAGLTEPVNIDRNLTVMCQSSSGMCVLDLGFLPSKLSLCDSCVLEFANIALDNDRRGAGGTIDFLGGRGPGFSRLVLRDGLRLRPACIMSQTGLLQTRLQARSPAFPGSQVSRMTNTSFRGVYYPDSLVTEDVSVRVDRTLEQVGGGVTGGYDLLMVNLTRLCSHYVDPRCTVTDTGDNCVIAIIEELQGGKAARVPVAAVAASVAAGVAVLAATVAALVWRRRRRAKAPPAPGPPAAVPDVTPSTEERVSPSTITMMSSGDGGPGSNEAWVVTCKLSHTEVPAQSKGSRGSVELSGRTDSAQGKQQSGRLATLTSDIVIGSLLGAGSFGKVYGATWHGSEVAVKVIDHADGIEAEAVATEARLLLSLEHPNVVKAYHLLQCSKTGPARPTAPSSSYGSLQHSAPGGAGGGQDLLVAWPQGSGSSGSEGLARTFIVQEFCSGGSLFEVVKGLRELAATSSSEFRLNLIALLEGAAAGMEHLHERHVVHGDLNARNVLVATESEPGSNSFGAIAKIADFGLARVVLSSHRTTLTVGTITHMPPERLTGGTMAPPGDVYAFGFMMWEVWTGRYAFQGLHHGAICSAVVLEDRRPEPPPDMPGEYSALMAACWIKDPHARPSMSEVRLRLQEMGEAFLGGPRGA